MTTAIEGGTVKEEVLIMNLNLTPRTAREKKTIEVMIGMYCKSHHVREGYLCDECSQILDYAGKRLDQCPFKNDKPTCVNCTVHCYKPDMRQIIREVMRYSGPQMIYRHPVLAFHHLIDRRRRPKGGYTILMPADVPNVLKIIRRFKMMLTKIDSIR
jgi:hypothetical protein